MTDDVAAVLPLYFAAIYGISTFATVLLVPRIRRLLTLPDGLSTLLILIALYIAVFYGSICLTIFIFHYGLKFDEFSLAVQDANRSLHFAWQLISPLLSR